MPSPRGPKRCAQCEVEGAIRSGAQSWRGGLGLGDVAGWSGVRVKRG